MALMQNNRAEDDMLQDPKWTAVDEYTMAHLHPPTRHSFQPIEQAAITSIANNIPGIACPAPVGKFLALQCRMIGAKHALEIGTLGGYSALWLACENPDLQVTTLEYDQHHISVARKVFAQTGLQDRIELVEGPALESLPRIYDDIMAGKRAKLDFAFIDADKLNNWNYFDWAVKMSRPGACIIVDNVVWKGKLADAGAAATDHMVKGGREVVEKVGQDSRVDATVLQIVGTKNYDGFLMAIVR